MALRFIHFILIITLNFLIFSQGRDHNEKVLEREYGKLVHVSAIFRHGERSPFSTYPRDPNKNYSWPDGLGQLLDTGKLRLYNLGKWFRRQYKDLLKTIRSHTQMMVESSDFDRTIMSAQYFMASFYKPNKTQRISKNIRWQPIPIHTSSLTEENYIWTYAHCLRDKYYTKKFFGTSKMKKKYDEHEKTFNYLHRHTDIVFSRNDLYNVGWNVYNILDILEIEESRNLTLPSWTKKVYPRTLQKLQKIFVYREYSDSRVLRLKIDKEYYECTCSHAHYCSVKIVLGNQKHMGPLINSIIASLESAKNLTNESRKVFHFYSGHDATIVPIMFALGNYNGVNPPFGSALVLEMRNKGNDSFIVVRYKNSSNSTSQVFNVPKCEKRCTVDKFIKIVRPLMVENWKLECQLKNRKNETVEDL